MPLFEFRCRICDHQFEQLVGRDERPACPQCAESAVEKLMSVSAGRMGTSGLPIASACPPSDAPPCSPHCCRMP
ncbi:MAG: zinc ribbon domain-containing protein [Planctomycetaceae bacterium]|nr:zinc ribbon domain-containing protein [Planctomycetaceae bacterium]